MIVYVPLGKGMLRNLLTFVTFYCMTVPIADLISPADVVTISQVVHRVISVASDNDAFQFDSTRV